MATTLVIFLFSTIVFFLFFILSSSKTSLNLEDNNSDDLDEWVCKSCGFNVQL